MVQLIQSFKKIFTKGQYGPSHIVFFKSLDKNTKQLNPYSLLTKFSAKDNMVNSYCLLKKICPKDNMVQPK